MTSPSKLISSSSSLFARLKGWYPCGIVCPLEYAIEGHEVDRAVMDSPPRSMPGLGERKYLDPEPLELCELSTPGRLSTVRALILRNKPTLPSVDSLSRSSEAVECGCRYICGTNALSSRH